MEIFLKKPKGNIEQETINDCDSLEKEKKNSITSDKYYQYITWSKMLRHQGNLGNLGHQDNYASTIGARKCICILK